MKRPYFLLGLAAIIVTPIWLFASPFVLSKLDPNYELSLQQKGETHLYNKDGIGWSVSQENLEVYDAVIEVSEDYYIIESEFRAYNREGTLDFDASSSYAIDPISRKNLSGIVEQDRSGLYMLPHFPKKTSYLMHSPLVLEEASELKFVEETSYLGEELYKYEYNIENVDKTQFFTLAELEDNEAIVGSHTGFILVEPVSGCIVFFSHRGKNNVVDKDTHELIRPYEEWFNVTNEDSGQSNLKKALEQKSKLRGLRFTPAILLIILALIFLGVDYGMQDKRFQNYLEEKDKNITKVSAAVVLISFLVLLGWAFNIEIFKSIIPGFVSMKSTTAISFMISGFILFLLNKTRKSKDTEQLLTIMLSCLLVLIMGVLLVSALLSININIENLLFPEEDGSTLTVSPGRPSYGTMLNFVLIGVIGLIDTLNRNTPRKILTFLSSIILTVGFIASIGYIVKVPSLYFALNGISTGMALHTTLLFIVISIALLKIYFKDKK